MRDERTPYDAKLDAILAAAAETFAAKGYHNASIRDIARATGVSLSGLYYYFQSKEELLYLIQDHAFATLLGKLEERLCGVTDPRQRLHILMDNQLNYFVNNMAEMKVLAHEADSLGGEFLFRLNARMRRLTDIAAEILRDLRPDSDIDPRVATFALFGMMNWIYTWYKPDRDVPVELLLDEMSRIFLYGFLGEGETAGAGLGGRSSLPGESAG